MGEVRLRLQDPGGEGEYLLEAVLGLASDAERGGGIFAFASADGINALVHDDSFEQLLRQGAFELVVGLDAVTNERAIKALQSASASFEGLSARALVHDESVLFHPKLSWFRRGGSLTLVVGSGNLTVRGLRENWEAFTVVELEGEDGDAAERQIAEWLAKHDALLLPPDDDRVQELAALNTGRERDLKHPRKATKHDSPPSSAEVLVAEAPKSGDRPSQVNFHKAHYEDFFGAKAGTQRRVTLREVRATGIVGEAEERKSSARMSRNFSLELTGFHGADRADGDPPFIGVYLKLPQGTFLYQRVSPNDAGYPALSDFLAERWTGRAGQMRQVSAPLGEVQEAWPESSLWGAEVPSE